MTQTSPLRTQTSPPRSPFRWLQWLWLALWPLATLLYLLPVSFIGERLILLLVLAGLWAGVVVTFWPYRPLRLVALVVAIDQFFPIRNGLTRLLLLCGLAALWLAAIVVFRQRRAVWIALLAGAAVLLGFLLLPGRAIDPSQLRAEYVRSLRPYQGAAYIWGGENRVGIDCSGLIRCGWIDANLRCGLCTANPEEIRQAIRIWWQDCSARELGEGYRDRTRTLLTTPALNRLDYGALLPGDVAVTHSGVHTLAYLGDRVWIEADPLAGGVLTVRAPAAGNPWFEEPMRIVRWSELERP
jgi:hypothetical protein